MKQTPGSSIFRRSPLAAAGLWASCGLALVGPAVAQRPAPDRTFQDTARVVEVQIPVNVVDRQGEPVRGLTAADFQIVDDGEQREILDFQVIDLDVLETGPSQTEIDEAVEAAARRHFLLLFDLSFSKPTSVIRARDAAREFVLEELHPTDLVAVGTHSVERGARLLVTFTPDRAQVARAIDTLGAPRLLRLTRQDPLRFMIDDPEASGFEPAIGFQDATDSQAVGGALRESVMAHLRVIGKEMAKQEKSFQRGRVSSWSRSMGDLARMLDSVQGRKHVVYFSEGFDGRLLLGRNPSSADPEFREDLINIQSGAYWLVDTDDMYGNTGLQSDVNVMLEEFRRADVVIQAVDISGLRADSAAERRISDVGEDALFYIANDTGGSLFENANDFGRELTQVLERSAVTYLLTFRADDVPADGAYRPLKVKADLPRGSRLTARKGYYAPRPYEELHPIEKSLLAADAIAAATPDQNVRLNVLAAPFRADESRAYVPIIIEAEGSSLLAGNEGDQLAVEFFAYVTDQRGEMRDFFTQLVSLDLGRGRERFVDSGLKYYGHLDLAPGDYLVRVLVRNANTGMAGVETLDLNVPSYDLAQPILLPPFFLEQGGSWFLVREKENLDYRRSVVYPFTVNGQPYIPAARPALSAEDVAQLCLVAYNLGSGTLDVDATIVAEDGTVIPGGELSLVERTITGIEGLDKFLAEFRPRGLSAGRYTLQVMLTDSVSGAAEVNSIPFTLRN